MHDHDSKYFAEFLKEFQKESDRGGALVGAAILDARLERLILSHMLPGKVSKDLVVGGNAPLGTFSSRINSCFALGLITSLERHDLNLVRNIRNEFAHREHGITFDDETIKGFCASRGPLPARRSVAAVQGEDPGNAGDRRGSCL
jgi:mannitol operon repressor